MSNVVTHIPVHIPDALSSPPEPLLHPTRDASAPAFPASLPDLPCSGQNQCSQQGTALKAVTAGCPTGRSWPLEATFSPVTTCHRPGAPICRALRCLSPHHGAQFSSQLRVPCRNHGVVNLEPSPPRDVCVTENPSQKIYMGNEVSFSVWLNVCQPVLIYPARLICNFQFSIGWL